MKSILPFTSEHEMYRNALGNFIDNQILPYYEEWGAVGYPPKEIFKQLGDNGYICAWADEKYGGVNADFLYEFILNEQFFIKGINSIGAILHSGVAVPYLNKFCNEEQKERWLPKCVSGEMISSVAMTEPGTGSDLQAIRTKAVKDGDHYIINGSKTFITNGGNCGISIVALKTGNSSDFRSISLIAVEEGTPGFSKGNRIPKIGFHCGDTTELFFEDCRVPAANLIGEEGKGFYYLMSELQQERLLSTIDTTFLAQHSLDLALEYADQRQLFGKKLSQFQNTQFVLAECAAEIECARSFIEKLTLAHMKHENVVKEVSMAKLWINEMAHRVSSRCLQLFGGYGYCEEYPISRQFVDSRLFTIVAGTSEIMKTIIAKEIGL